MDFFSIEKSESFPCILKIKTFNDSYEYNNIPSDLFDKQKLIEMIKELNVELKPKSKALTNFLNIILSIIIIKIVLILLNR